MHSKASIIILLYIIKSNHSKLISQSADT